MSLDDQEQKILAEIERQFYEEDPELARAVKDIRRPTRISLRLALIGVMSGLAVVIGFFTTNIIAAFLGFALLLGSATALVPALKAGAWGRDTSESETEQAE